MSKKISVIIPCYNAVKWLPQCFLSLVGQTMGIDNLELIFVNDASTDGGATWSLLEEMERAYPESVIIIDLPSNRRQGGARNEGLKYASGEYVSFVDADDRVESNLYEVVYAKAKEHQADIVQFNHKYYFENKGVILNPVTMPDKTIIINSEEERKQMLLSEELTYGCWNKIYKRELITCAGVQYAENVIYEEPLFVYPLLFYGNRFVITNEYLYVYRQNNLGTMRNDMRAEETLKQHAEVQLKVWEFMKETEFFEAFYEEIKMYFLHTYLYEMLDFAKQREMETEFEYFLELADKAGKEVDDITKTPYDKLLVKQMELYRMIENGLTREKLQDYIKKI